MICIRFAILGSGSAGNCAYVETENARFLVDAGLSGRQIAQRLEKIGRSIKDIQAILLTHEHSDHVAGLSVLANRMQIPVYANQVTMDELCSQFSKFRNWKIFTTGERFKLGNAQIQSFPVPHDACEPVGYTVSVKDHTIGFLTDLGYATRLVIERVRPCTVLVLESNHDVGLLQNTEKRPWSIKQRVLTRHGHLSNAAAAELLGKAASPRLQHLFLCHLSEDCNRPELALATIQSKLKELDISHITVHQTFQKKSTPLLELHPVNQSACVS